MTFAETLARYRALRDVPTRSDAVGMDRLDAAFEDFPRGTPVEDVWHALEADCPEFSVGDAMNGKYAE